MKPISTAEPRDESRPIRTPLRASGERLGAISTLFVRRQSDRTGLLDSSIIGVPRSRFKGGVAAVTQPFDKRDSLCRRDGSEKRVANKTLLDGLPGSTVETKNKIDAVKRRVV